MSLSTALQRWFPGAVEERANPAISIYDWAKMWAPGGQVNYNGTTYQAFQTNLTGGQLGHYYGSNAIVFACTANRILLFSEARFQFQGLRSGRPGDLFGTPELAVLEEPWVGHSTRDLLAQADMDVTMYGNSYWARDPQNTRYLLRLDPCKVFIITEAATDEIYGRTVGERLLAYRYQIDRETFVDYLPGELAHHKPYPDPNNRFVGMSWLNACLPDVRADVSMTTHKLSSLDSGAKLGVVVTLGMPNGAVAQGPTPDQFADWVRVYRAEHEGAQNAGKTLFLGPGADVKTVGQTFENLEMKATQGAGETRIAACSGVPPVIVGLSEGLSSATYSNYGQARRRLVDGTMRPLWGFFASAMQSIINTPPASRLWYDDRDIPFLREDVMDQAEILAKDAITIRTLTDAGYDPDAVVDAVKSGDLARLAGKHSGLFSVQLQPPGTEAPDTEDTPAVPPAA